jgi:membrane dipeptidase
MDRTNGGLSDFGVSVVKEMNRLGMLIDIAQLSEKGTQDVLEMSTSPVIASNSNARSLCSHPRNLSDNVIKLMGEKGGVIGIHSLPAFLRDDSQASVEDMLDHMDHIVELTSVNQVGLGPDLLEDWPKERYACIWGEGQNLGDQKISFDYPKGFESISKIPNLRKMLIDRGYSTKETSKVLGGNFLRVFKQVLS